MSKDAPHLLLVPKTPKDPLYLYVNAMERERAKADWKRERPRGRRASDKGKQ